MNLPAMDRTLRLLMLICISTIFLFDLCRSMDSEELDLVSKTRNSNTPMVFPLMFSSIPNRTEDYRRRLQQSQLPNAQMKLHDDLLANGYYTTRLWIGTPPQEFALIVDTGSTVTYVPCSTCKHCGNHQDPKFQPEKSSTYEGLKCNPDCNCDDEGKLCVYERRYAEMSSSSGVLSEDVISFGNESQLSPQRAIFGCENAETGDLFSQRADGIMGLGRGKISIVDQLVDKNLIEDSFSLCYGGMDVGGGAMVLGNISLPADMVFSYSDPFRSPYYNIDLKQLHVAGKSLKLSPQVFDKRHGTVLDSGTTYAYFPKQVFNAFKDAVIREIPFLKRIHGPDPNYGDICFAGAGSNVSELHKVFPEVAMEFEKGKKLVLSPENYLFRHTKVKGAYCLGFFPNADSTTLLGGIIVRNTLVTYDRKNDKIGFWKTNCSELWRKLAPISESPPPAPSFAQNITPEISPTSNPNGVFKIGTITFEVSISVHNSSIKPNLTELAEFIAHELNIDGSQVHLLNFSSRENEYLLKWGIFPPQLSEYISNTTASNIIKLLKENRLHLPERFGSYKLVEWKAETMEKSSWWKEHEVGIAVVGIISALLIALLTIKVAMIWRQRRKEENVPYEPVSSDVIKEHELQPLSSQTSHV